MQQILKYKIDKYEWSFQKICSLENVNLLKTAVEPVQWVVVDSSGAVDGDGVDGDGGDGGDSGDDGGDDEARF